jgi:hypothetical protein
MRTSFIGSAVASVLMAPASGGDVVVDNAGRQTEGTVISKELHKAAVTAIKAAWKAADTVANASKLVLELAQSAVREADGDEKLALAKFDAAMGSAAVELRMAHKDATGEEKERLEDFLDKGGIWLQYQSNMRGYIRTFDPEQFQTFKTESAARKARKAIQDATKTRKGLRDKIAETHNLEDITDEQFADAMRASVKDGGGYDEKKLLAKLISLGAEELDSDESEEERITRQYGEAKAAAVHWFGESEQWTVCRESLAKLLVRIAEIPDDAGKAEQLNQALNNCYVKINQIYSQERKPAGEADRKTATL